MTAEPVRLAVAQVEVSEAVPTGDRLRHAGQGVREALIEAVRLGARVVQFPEGTLTYPSKRLISERAPEIGEADWSVLDWGVLREELESIAAVAAHAGVFVVVGAPHRLSDGGRPHNSLYVISDRGEVVTRYDKQYLSTTEITYMYTPGERPIVFEVDGMRFGMALCLEVLFPELFVSYATESDVDAVLVSSAPDPRFRILTEAYGLSNVMSIGLSFAANPAVGARSGVCAPAGWVASTDNGEPAVLVADVNPVPRELRSFHRMARSGLYDSRLGHQDPRSLDRTSF